MKRGLGVALAVLAWALPGLAAARPVWTDARSLASAGGNVRVHYTTTGVDAVLIGDVNGDLVPDYVAEVAAVADTTLANLASRGFRAPLGDGTLGGDGRFDIYLINFASADGHFMGETCSGAPRTCSGYIEMENDLVGFSYPTRSEGIQVLVSHELFHAVQAAYPGDLPVAWSEGSATWNEEIAFPAQNDFERLIPSFLAKTARPFERSGAGFGDLYPYGAALWPHYLELKFGAGTVRGVFELAPMEFLDAADSVLRGKGSSLGAAFAEFTRWNLMTAERSDPARGWPAAAGWPSVMLEPALAGALPLSGEVWVEGLSARYQPIDVEAGAGAQKLRLTATPGGGAEVALGLYVWDGRQLGELVEGRAEAGALLAEVTPGAATRLFAVVSGVTRGKALAPIALTLEVAPAVSPSPKPGGDGGGCAVGVGVGQGGGEGGGLGLVGLVGLLMVLGGVIGAQRPRPSTSTSTSTSGRDRVR